MVEAWPRGAGGAIAPPHFCQDGARDFLKIDEKVGGEWGKLHIFRELEGVAKKSHLWLSNGSQWSSPLL